MDRVFSVDEIAETFWPVDSPVNIDTKINRSSSEWTFQRFLEEATKSEQVASANDSSCVSSVSILPSTSCSSFPNGNSNVKNGTVNDVIEIKGSHFSGIPADSEEYQAILKHQLSLACAAVARSRQASSVTSKESLPLVDKRSPATDTVPSAPESLGSEYCVSRTQDKSSGGSTSILALSVLQKNSGVQMKQTTSESSREQSDEDDLEAETENTENMHPNDAKRVRRMISNRESARRSRRRKQAHLTELETRVGQLRVENSSLMKRLTDISQKYNEASVDNRILKADVETLRAKVKMAEDTVKRVTGLNPPLQTIPDVSSFSIPFTRPETIDTSIPVPEDQNHFFQPSQDSRLNNGITPVLSPCLEDIHNSKTQMGRSTSMQRVASLEHLQKWIRPGSGSCGIPCSGTQSGM